MSKSFFLLFFISINFFSFSQIDKVEKEVMPPYNIKTVQFIQNDQNVTPVFQLGDSFQFSFDDLFGNEANYYYSIVLYDYNWKPSELSRNEYLVGFDEQRIQDYTNSFNTLQIYSHYSFSLPNRLTQCKVSGNYMLKILNDDKEVIFSRKFILYENLVSVPVQVRRARTGLDLNTKHDLDFSITSKSINFQNPVSNVKVFITQNGDLEHGIKNVKPQYTIGNDLIYKYDTETQFWAGNEFLFFDSKDIRISGSNIAYVDSKSGVYNTHLFTSGARANSQYTYFPDVNGNFVVRRLNADNNQIEADYSWVFFTLSAPAYFEKKDIYINGMFNNYGLTAENKMDYNASKGIYEKAIMIKQGFTNFQYVVADSKGNVDRENAIDGNFYQTENNYTVLVYYRENGQRNDRVIGKGDANSSDIIN